MYRFHRPQVDLDLTNRSSSNGIGSSADNKPKTLVQHVLRHIVSHVDNEPLIPLANMLFSGEEGARIATEEEGFRAYLAVLRHDMELKNSTTRRIIQNDLHVNEGALRDSILGSFQYILHGLDNMNHRMGTGPVHVIEDDEDDDTGIGLQGGHELFEQQQQPQQQQNRKRSYTLYESGELYCYFGLSN